MELYNIDSYLYSTGVVGVRTWRANEKSVHCAMAQLKRAA